MSTVSNGMSNTIIAGTSGNDSVYNYGHRVTVDAGAGNDTIRNSYANNVSINAGAGNDSVYNYSGVNVTISGGTGDDTISGYGAGTVYIYNSGDGKDIFYGLNDDDTILIPSGSWSTAKSGDDVIITVGTGNLTLKGAATLSAINITSSATNIRPVNVIQNTTSNTLITGTAYRDSVYNNYSSVTIDAGEGNDTIQNSYANNVSINAGAGNDSVYNSSGVNVTISGGTGDDTIYVNNNAKRNVIKYAVGDGNDTVYGYNVSDTVSLTGGSVIRTSVSGNDLILTTSNGSIRFVDTRSVNVNGTGYGTYSTVSTSGNDTLTNFKSNVTINALAGNDSILTGGANVSVNSGTGNDTVTNYGLNATINLDSGNNRVYNYEKSKIIGGTDADEIYNYGASVSADGGADDDYIYNYGSYATILGGAGKDSIYNSNGSYSTINAGVGDDSIYNNSSQVTIDGGEGNDTILRGNADYNSINGGAGNDYVSLFGSTNWGWGTTVRGGMGNDTINNVIASSNYGNIYQYTAGDGNDLIQGLRAIDTIQIGNGTSDTFSSVTSDNDVILTVSNGSIMLKGAATLSTLNVLGKCVSGSSPTVPSNVVSLTANNDTYTNTASNVAILALAGNDNITNKGASVSVDGGTGNDRILNSLAANVTITGGDDDDLVENYYAQNVSIETGAGRDTVYHYNNRTSVAANIAIDTGADNDRIYNYDGSNVSIAAGAGDDYILSSKTSLNVTLDGGAGNDQIYSYGNKVTIIGGTGDDSLKNDGGANVLFEYSAGDGNDTILGFNATSTLKIGNGSTDTFSSLTSDNDVIISADNGSITLSGATTLSTLNVLGKYVSGSSPTVPSNVVSLTANNDTYTNTVAGVAILALGGNDRVTNSGASVSVDGGAGNDYLYGSATKVSLNGGDGNDTLENIDNLGSKESALLGGAGNDSIKNMGNESFIDGGADSDTLYNYAQASTILGDSGNDTIYNYGQSISADGGAGNDYIYSNGNYAMIVGGADNDSIDNRSTTNASIDGGAGDDSIKSTSSMSNIFGGEGNDSISNNKGGSNTTISGGEGNDSIRNISYNSSVSISGGAGDDSLINAGLNAKINGGTGNDFISISGSNNLIEYAAGDGNDSVVGFNATASLKIGNGTTDTFSSLTSGDDVIISVDDGSITLSGAATLSALNVLGKYETIAGGEATLTIDGDRAIYANEEEVLFTIYGISETAKVTDFTITGTTVTISKNVLNQDDLFLEGEGYTLALASDISTTSTKISGAWSALTEGKATYTASGYSEYYTLDGNTVNYTEAEGGEQFAVNGIKSTLSSAIQIDEENKTVTICAAALNAGSVTFSGDDFTVSLGDDVIKEPVAGDSKFTSLVSGTATYKVSGDKAYYTLGENVISYTAGTADKEFTISGLAESLTLKDGEIENISVAQGDSGVTFTLYEDALKNSNVKLTGSGATLALDDAVKQSAESIAGAWSDVVDGAASYRTNGKTKYYTLSSTQVVYHAAVAGTLEIELTGLDSAAVTENGIIKGIDVSEDALTLSGNVGKDFAIKTNKNNLPINLEKTVENISLTGTNNADTINVIGKNITVKGGGGQDVIDMLGTGGIVQYASGDGNDTLNYSEDYTLKITSGKVGVAYLNGDNVVIPVDKGSITIKDAKGQPINLISADGTSTVIVVEQYLVYNDNNTAVSLMPEFEGTLAATDYDNKVSTIVASEVIAPIELYGNKNANLIVANDNKNTLHGGAGNDTIIGGAILSGDAGNDVFVYSGGEVKVTDYVANVDKISLDGATISNVKINGNDLVLGFGNADSLTLANAAKKRISFSEGRTAKQYNFEDDKIFNSNKTAVTLTASGTEINAGVYSKLVTIDATQPDAPIKISGNAKNNSIVASDNGATLNGGKGNDTLRGGDGADIFIYEKNSGNDFILNFTAEDKISLGAGASLTSVTINKNGDTALKIGNNTVTLKKVVGEVSGVKQITLIDENGETTQTYYTDKTVYGNGVTLNSAFKQKTFTADSNIVTVDAKSVMQAVNISGNANNNILIGGMRQDTLNGGAGNDTLTGNNGVDTFVYSTGNDVITDYANNDKISLGAATLSGFSVNNDDVVLNLGGNNSLTILDAANKKITFAEGRKLNVNIFKAEGMLNAANTAITLGSAMKTFTADAKLATIDASATEKISVLGNAKANKIIAGSGGATLNGGTGNDTLIGGSGADIFAYNNNGGNKIIQDYGAGDKISLGGGAVVTDIYSSRGNYIVKIGKNSITVKNSSEFVFTENGTDKTFKNGLIYNANGTEVTAPASFKQDVQTPLSLTATKIDGSANRNPLNIAANAANSTINGGMRNDTLKGSAGSDTINGGAGNDSLWGGTGNDTFIFQAGGGTDTILDYASGDLLTILDKDGSAGSFKKSAFNNDMLTLTINGGGRVSFKNVDASTAFNINGEIYHVNGRTLAK